MGIVENRMDLLVIISVFHTSLGLLAHDWSHMM